MGSVTYVIRSKDFFFMDLQVGPPEHSVEWVTHYEDADHFDRLEMAEWTARHFKLTDYQIVKVENGVEYVPE